MNINNSRLLRLSLIGALAFSVVPTAPNIALAAGGSTERCDGAVNLPGARLAVDAETIFFGYLPVTGSGELAWTCTTANGETAQETDCGNRGHPTRWVRAELRNGVVYLNCE